MQPLATEFGRTPRVIRLQWAPFTVLSVSGFLLFPSMGSAQNSAVEAGLRPLLIAAIGAPDGRAAGTLEGPLADVLRTRGISAAPLVVEVTTLRAYREPGCKRLNVRFQQRDVKLGDAPPADRELAFQLNYCRDGEPPRSLE